MEKFFFDGHGGTGKTFPLNLLLVKGWSKHDIPLAIASFANAIRLLEVLLYASKRFPEYYPVICNESPLERRSYCRAAVRPVVANKKCWFLGNSKHAITVCFEIDINISQCQTLKVAEVDLRENCWSYDQFYVTCFRVSVQSRLVFPALLGKIKNFINNNKFRSFL